jgi:hypothetical protein
MRVAVLGLSHNAGSAAHAATPTGPTVTLAADDIYFWRTNYTFILSLSASQLAT